MVTPLLSPKFGLPKLIESESEFESALEHLDKGKGPIAVDAERASGFKYSARAYLIQLNRKDGGLHLIDPISVGNSKLWGQFNSAFHDEEWILHASTQDLNCLRELGLNPSKIFDTELGGRIAGFERVGLGSLCEELLELQLAKEHSAVDWSTRPLKTEWLNYAALDVDVLIDLRDEVEKVLIEQNKWEWASQEFAHVLTLNLTPERQDPWRRVSGMHKIRDRRSINAIKNLWLARDSYARDKDIAPGRVFNDETMLELIAKNPTSLEEFTRILLKRTRYQDLPAANWFEVLQESLNAPDSELPPMRGTGSGLPAIKIWESKNPSGYARATHVRARVVELAKEHGLPAENLISPDAVKRLCWVEPDARNPLAFIESTLASAGARPWQIDLVASALVEPILETQPLRVVIEAENETGITQQ